jgi:hypothetical protein
MLVGELAPFVWTGVGRRLADASTDSRETTTLARGSDAAMELFRVEAARAPGRNCGLGGLSRKNREPGLHCCNGNRWVGENSI